MLWPAIRSSPEGVRYRKFWFCLTPALALLATTLALSPQAESPEPTPRKTAFPSAPELIYAQDPNDAWNRIFYFLFSRRIQARLSDEFPEGAPFSEKPLFESDALPKVHASTRLFERTEIGDRAIDPLYQLFPAFVGSRIVLDEPAAAEFTKALGDALDESVPRAATARALMQNDLWAARDLLSVGFTLPGGRRLEPRRLQIVDLISLLIRKIALTPKEIQSLPDNYAAAVHRHLLPDLFRKNNGWVEVQWFPERLHDAAAGYRRVARIFLKPTHPPRDMRNFLKTERDRNDPSTELDGAALLTQLLLIDTHGNLQPTTLTTEIQTRLFARTNGGEFQRTTLQVAEISRRLLVRDPASGGLVPEDEMTPIYLPMAGNDYGFASIQPDTLAPALVHLRTRCLFCHGDKDLRVLLTFAMARMPGRRLPPVRQLDAAGHQAADFVIRQKTKRAEFEALREHFERGAQASPH
jgi:hypothetical protein